MRWQHKARIARICAGLPGGDTLYKLGQRRLGNLRVDPRKRLAAHASMCRWLAAAGKAVRDGRVMEVGTGHVPVVPIGFFLAGAARTITVDLYRRIDWKLTTETLRWIASHPEALAATYPEEVIPGSLLEEKLALLRRECADPQRFFEAAGIEYVAPQDAARMALPSQSIDCHYSYTVLEHIPEAALRAILREGRRLIRDDGVALHFVDLSDHFQHQDSSISRINFLRYSQAQWQQIAGNAFMYCNRLRASDFRRLIDELGFQVLRVQEDVDPASQQALQSGFRVDSDFADRAADDLCTTSFKVLLGKGGPEAATLWQA